MDTANPLIRSGNQSDVDAYMLNLRTQICIDAHALEYFETCYMALIDFEDRLRTMLGQKAATK